MGEEVQLLTQNKVLNKPGSISHIKYEKKIDTITISMMIAIKSEIQEFVNDFSGNDYLRRTGISRLTDKAY